MSFFTSINDGAMTVLFNALGYDVTALELFAVVTSLVGVWLGTTGTTITWPWWAFSSALYGWLFYNWDLYASALLQIVFIAAAVWGWFGWGPKGAESRTLSWSSRAVIVAGGLVAWYLITPVLISWGAAAAKPDAFGLVFSVVAQVIMALEYRENWAVWFVVDAAYTVLYWGQDLRFTSLVYLVFTAIALRGWINWKKMEGELSSLVESQLTR